MFILETVSPWLGDKQYFVHQENNEQGTGLLALDVSPYKEITDKTENHNKT